MTKHNSLSLNVLLGIAALLPLILLATFRYPGMTPDTLSYFEITNDIFSESGSSIEPFHYLLVVALRHVGFDAALATTIIFFIYISLSYFALYRGFSRFSYTSFILVVYSLFSYVYLNLVQMRWGLAIALIVWALSQLTVSRFRSLLLLFFAIMVHYYSLIAFFFVFLSRSAPNKLFYFSLPFVGFVFSEYFTPEYLTAMIELVFGTAAMGATEFHVVNKVLFYAERSEIKDNLFNSYTIFSLTSYFGALLFSKRLDFISINLFIKVVGFFLFLFFAFHSIPILSRRVMLMLVVFSIPLALFVGNRFRPKGITQMALLIYASIAFVNLSFFHGLLRL